MNKKVKDKKCTAYECLTSPVNRAIDLELTNCMTEYIYTVYNLFLPLLSISLHNYWHSFFQM